VSRLVGARPHPLASGSVITQPLADLFDGSRAVTVRSRRGRLLLRVGLGTAMAAGVASVLLAPRATAVIAVGAMFRGVSLGIDRAEVVPQASEAA
jgi:hypothetical protein